MKSFFTLLFFLPLITIAQQGQKKWINISPDSVVNIPAKGSLNFPSIEVTSAGDPIVAFEAYNNFSGAYTASVRKLVNDKWVQLGDTNATGGSAKNIAFALGLNDTAFIAYTDGTAANKLSVKKWNGTAWVLVGSAGFSPTNAENIRLKTDALGGIYVLYKPFYSYSIIIMKWNGSAWVQLGTTQTNSQNPTYADLGVDATTGTPYYAYVLDPNITFSYVQCKKFDGTNWVSLGNAGQGINPTLAIASNNETYMLFHNTGGQVKVSKYTAGAWGQVGGLSQYAATNSTIRFDGAGVPYIAYKQYLGNNSDGLKIKKLQNNAWVDAGVDGIAGNVIEQTDLAFSTSGVPFISYLNGTTIDVKKQVGVNFLMAGKMGISTGRVRDTEVKTDTAGNVYVGYLDEDYQSHGSVMKYDGTTWTQIGLPGFALAVSNIERVFSLAVSKNGTPYVAYAEEGQFAAYGKLTVRKWDGFNWVLVGTQGISSGSVLAVEIALDTLDVPYVIYRDNSLSEKVIVRKWNGVAWQYLGSSAGINSSASYGTSIVISKNNTPFIAYYDVNSYNIVAQQWNGFSWVSVGTAVTFSQYYPEGVDIVTDSLGFPIVGYYQSNNAFVSKWDGANWNLLGGQNALLGSYFTPLHLAYSSTNKLYAGISQFWNSMPGSAFRYSGSQWDNLGDLNFRSANLVNVDVDNSNIISHVNYLYTTFNGPGLFAKVFDDNPIPIATVTIPSDTVCIGGAATFSSTVQFGGNNLTYQWRVNANPIAGATNSIFSINTLITGDSVDVVVTGSTLGHYKDTSNAITIFVDTVFIFTGAVDSLWSNSLNWCGGSVPSAMNDVRVLSGVTVSVDVPALCHNLHLLQGTILNFIGAGNSLLVGNEMVNEGEIQNGNGLVQVAVP